MELMIIPTRAEKRKFMMAQTASCACPVDRSSALGLRALFTNPEVLVFFSNPRDTSISDLQKLPEDIPKTVPGQSK